MQQWVNRKAVTSLLSRAFHFLLIFLFLLVTVRGAFALEITSVTVPQSIQEGDLLNLSFTTDEAASYSILFDGSLVSSTNAYSQVLGYDTAGLHTLTFEAVGTETVSEDRSIEVIDKPLQMTILEPAVNDYASNLINVNVATNIPVDLCYTVLDGGTHTLDAINGTAHNGSLTLTDGLHSLTVKCNRNGEIVEEDRTIRIDTVPPTVTASPSGTVYDSVTLTATTNEITTCRYDTAQVIYDAMANDFPETGEEHQKTLQLSEGSHTYYLSCRDVYGNTAATLSTAFTLLHKPTAEIEVEGDNPHKAGQYEVRLTVSEELQEMPKLTLTYQEGGSRTLALTKDGERTYKGYVIVEEDAGEEVASWTFSGKDTDGLVGTEITKGELFLIDTIIPEKVETFRAENATGAVKLSWYYDKEGQFNLYRSTSMGVDYTHYYKTVSGSEFLDLDVGGVVRYYYRIAPIDDAGNIGPLSHEEWASPVQGERDVSVLDPALLLPLERQLERLDIYLLDAERVLTDLQSESDPDRSWVIAFLNLLPEAKKATQQLRNARSSLEGLKELSLSKAEYDSRSMTIQNEIDTALSLLPYNIAISNGVEYEETTSDDELEAAATHLLRGRSLDEATKEKYLATALDVQSAIRIDVKAAHAVITYSDGKTREQTLVEKHLLSDGLQDVSAIEIIPKSAAEHASEISFFTATPVVLEEDPVFQYSFSSLTDEKIRYAYPGLVDMPAIKESSLVLMPKPSNEAVQSTSPQDEAITGRASFTFPGGVSNGEALLVFFGIIVIVGLLFYYFRVENDDGFEVMSRAGQGLPYQQGAQPFMQAYQPYQQISQAPQAPQMQTLVVTKREESLTSLLVKGHSLIDENRYFDALFFYKKALELYVISSFSSEELRQAIYQELELFHAKLNLYNTTSRAHDMVYVDDGEGLTALMHEMREYASRVGEGETRLLEKAKQDYLFFYEQLNRMKMGHDHL